MVKPKITLFGHYARGTEAADGQTVKTRTVYKALIEKYSDNNVSMYDTYKWRRKPVKLLLACLSAARRSTDVLMMPAHNGVQVFLPIFYILSIFFGFKTHYIVIGGWIAALAERKKILKFVLKRMSFIYAETETMKIKLADQGLVNVEVVPNFKDVKVVSNVYLEDAPIQPLRLCTFSRVTLQKGIEDAINSVIRVNESSGSVVYTLDIYGKVDADYSEAFFKIIKQSPDFIEYKGVADFASSTKILRNYYLLLFPTLFYTEGIPGTIIDAYAAGLPVVSTRWESFADIVNENVTGFGYAMGDVDELTRILEARIVDRNLSSMRKKCTETSKKFTAEYAMKPIYSRLERQNGEDNV